MESLVRDRRTAVRVGLIAKELVIKTPEIIDGICELSGEARPCFAIRFSGPDRTEYLVDMDVVSDAVLTALDRRGF